MGVLSSVAQQAVGDEIQPTEPLASRASGTTTGLSLQSVIDRALETAPDVSVQRERLSESRGQLISSAAPFNATISANVSGLRQDQPVVVPGDQVVRTRNDLMTYRLSIAKRYRFGLEVEPNVQLERTEAITEGLSPYVSTAVGIDASMPLLDGRGWKAQASLERAAAASYRAATAETKFTLSNSILRSALLYWEFRAATKRLDILREAERRAQEFVHETQRLVDADERPAADLQQLVANLADRRAARFAGEQAEFETRQRLGVAMGLSAAEIDHLPSPSQAFPGQSVSGDSLLALGNVRFGDPAQLVSDAMERRWDIVAARRSQMASQRVLEGVRTSRHPNLDLDLSLGYVGLERGSQLQQYLHAFDTNVGGASISVALRYRWPIRNSLAAGDIATQEATYSRSTIIVQNLEREVRSRLRIALHGLRRSSVELLASREATRLYATAAENERKKVRLGMSTELDLLLIEDRLTDALLARIDAQRRHARALATLRFESGQLLPNQSTLRPRVSALRLTTLPAFPMETRTSSQ